MHNPQLLREIEILPPELQKQVFDFVIFYENNSKNSWSKKGQWANIEIK